MAKARTLGTLALAGLLLAACGLDRPATVPTTSPTGSSTAALPEDGRPLLPVPSITPAGFADPPPGTGLRRYEQQQIAWRPCGQTFECTRVLVPLDYAAPDQTAITLTLARKPSTSARRLGSLFINPGGPGGSGVNYVGSFDSTGLGDYDILGWDPRGVGASTPVSCSGAANLDRSYAMDNSPDDDAELQARIEDQRAFGRSCLERSGVLLRHISTVETVRDLDLLRGLVGDDRLSYFGSSYGTRIGALYAELFPGRVGRMVLDGAVNINREVSLTQVEGFERALNHFAEWCAERRCRMGTQRDDVLFVIKSFLDRLDSSPLPVPGGRPLTQQLGVEAVFFSMYSQSSWGPLADALTAAIFSGDGRALLQLADLSNRRSADGTYGQLSYAFPAIRCLDSQEVSVRGAQKQLAEAARDAPVLGSLGGPDLVCPLWPVAPAPPPPKVVARGAPPIVVIGTTGDPATPFEYASSMADELASGLLVRFDGEGHLAYGQSACVGQIVVDYLARGQAPPDGTRC